MCIHLLEPVEFEVDALDSLPAKVAQEGSCAYWALVCIIMSVYIYIYIYVEGERKRERERETYNM